MVNLKSSLFEINNVCNDSSSEEKSLFCIVRGYEYDVKALINTLNRYIKHFFNDKFEYNKINLKMKPDDNLYKIDYYERKDGISKNNKFLMYYVGTDYRMENYVYNFNKKSVMYKIEGQKIDIHTTETALKKFKKLLSFKDLEYLENYNCHKFYV